MNTRFVKHGRLLVAMTLVWVMTAPSWAAKKTAPTTITAVLSSNLNFVNLDDPNNWKRSPGVNVALDQMVVTPVASQDLPPNQWRFVKVQAVHDGTTILFRCQWNDATYDASVADPPLFADGLAMQFPFFVNAGFEMGSQTAPVNILFWRADLPMVQNVVSGGPGTVQKTPDADLLPIQHYQSWANGVWTLIIARPLSGTASVNGNLVSFVPGNSYRVIFANWDGSNDERGGTKRICGSWQTLTVKLR